MRCEVRADRARARRSPRCTASSVTRSAFSIRAATSSPYSSRRCGNSCGVGLRGLAVLDRRVRRVEALGVVEADLDASSKRRHGVRRTRAGCRASSGCRCRSGQSAMRGSRARPCARARSAPRRRAARRRACAPSGRRGRASGRAGRRRRVLSGPYVGLRPETPQNAAGMRIEPPVSVPSASAAGAGGERDAPSRRCDPPGTRSGSYGLRHGGKCGLTLVMPHANSCVSVLPTTIAPASRARSHRRASAFGTWPGEDARAVGRAHARGVEQVLDGERQALQRAGRAVARRPARRAWPPRARARA